MEKTAIIYARVSSVGQAEEELPAESQIEVCVARAAELGASVVRIFRDDGKSGRTDKRKDFQDAIDYCHVHAIDYFILWNTARFARNKALAAWTKVRLRKLGTELVYVSQRIDTNTDEGWLLEGIFELMDEQQSRTISKDTMRSMVKNARDGFFNGGQVPLGYVSVPAGKRRRLAVEPAEAELVRYIFARYLQGYGTKAIALELNAAGRTRRGKRWDKTTVRNMLGNHVYTGSVVFNRVDNRRPRPREEWIVTPSHEAIISQEDFAMVQEELADRAPRIEGSSSRSNFVFSGLLRCVECGSMLQTESATGRSSVYHYYNCSRAQKGGGCRHRRLPAAKLDRILIDGIFEKIFTREAIEEIVVDLHQAAGRWVKNRERQRESIAKSLRDVEGRLSNLYGILELQGAAAPNLGDLSERLHELRRQRSELERSLSDLDRATAPAVHISADDIDQVHQILHTVVADSADPRKQREFFSGFISQIIVGDAECRVKWHPEKMVNCAVHSDVIWLPDRALLRTAVLVVPLPHKLARAA